MFVFTLLLIYVSYVIFRSVVPHPRDRIPSRPCLYPFFLKMVLVLSFFVSQELGDPIRVIDWISGPRRVPIVIPFEESGLFNADAGSIFMAPEGQGSSF